MKTTENNKLIAEFMPNWDGRFYHIPEKGKYHKLQLQFHSSWDWLMPVVKKIDDIWSEHAQSYYFHIGEIQDKMSENFLSANIEGVYKAVIKFINWYNTQEK